MQRIWKFAITGGPCGGKTEGIPMVKKFFESGGYKVFTIPEAATIIKEEIGLDFSDLSNYEFQTAVLEVMLYLEEQAMQFANKMEQDVIILCDRGIMDNKAYMPYEDFLKLLKEHELSEDTALIQYDAVFHLVTVADGAEKYYKLEGARHEDAETARKLDKKTMDLNDFLNNYRLNLDNNVEIKNIIFFNFSDCNFRNTNIVIPKSVTYISYQAFAYNTNLLSIAIPNTVTNIGYSAFKRSNNISTIFLEEGSIFEDKHLYNDRDLTPNCKIIRTKFENGLPVIPPEGESEGESP